MILHNAVRPHEQKGVRHGIPKYYIAFWLFHELDQEKRLTVQWAGLIPLVDMHAEHRGSSPWGSHARVVSSEAGFVYCQYSIPIPIVSLRRNGKIRTEQRNNGPWWWYPNWVGIIVGTLLIHGYCKVWLASWTHPSSACTTDIQS